jgi:16S rRNA (uracil1498-N3)-methyltransferase
MGTQMNKDHTPPQFFANEGTRQADHVVLSGDQFRHAMAQRLSPGEEFRVVFPETTIHAIVERVEGGNLIGSIVYEVQKKKSPFAVHLAPCLLKGQKMELVVEKATELGVASITPLVSMRTVPRLNSQKEQARTQRWERIAKSAAQQCARPDIPIIQEITPLKVFITNEATSGAKIFAYEKRESCAEIQEAIKGTNEVTVIIGPEGGFDATEVSVMTDAGYVPVSLGPFIVRAETASISMMAILVERLSSALCL